MTSWAPRLELGACLRASAAALSVLLLAAACTGTSTTSAGGSSPSAAASAVTPSAASCASPEAAQFDFWVGTWLGKWSDAAGPATASDIIVKAGCEIDETFTAARFMGHTSYTATSRSNWDPTSKRWVQDYRDSVGERSRWFGTLSNGAMTLIGPQVGTRQQRVAWRDIKPSSWVWEYDSSTDTSTWDALLVIPYARVG